MIDYTDLGSRIRKLRREANITQGELAEKLGLSASFLGHIERGTRVASLETLVQICNELKTTPTHLLSASLDATAMDHVHITMSAEQLKDLQENLRVAQEVLSHWDS